MHFVILQMKIYNNIRKLTFQWDVEQFVEVLLQLSKIPKSGKAYSWAFSNK